MKSKKESIFLLFFFCLIALTGCSQTTGEQTNRQKTDGLDKLGTISVISREDGSGTRETFAQLAGFAKSEKDSSDSTRKDAQIKKDSEEIIASVKNDVKAIGYVSKGALNGNDVKTLSVNQIGLDTKNGNYPLNRSFYIVYTGKLNDVEQDFLTYIHGAGQKIVEKSYVPVAKSSTFLSSKAKGTITINGSTSVAPLMEELAKEYMKTNPNAKLLITATDSTDGINQAMQKKCDFGMSSRDLKDYEKELLNYEVIANDEIAVIVNNENPLSNISTDSLKDIYTGTMKEWKELNK